VRTALSYCRHSPWEIHNLIYCSTNALRPRNKLSPHYIGLRDPKIEPQSSWSPSRRLPWWGWLSSSAERYTASGAPRTCSPVRFLSKPSEACTRPLWPSGTSRRSRQAAETSVVNRWSGGRDVSSPERDIGRGTRDTDNDWVKRLPDTFSSWLIHNSPKYLEWNSA